MQNTAVEYDTVVWNGETGSSCIGQSPTDAINPITNPRGMAIASGRVSCTPASPTPLAPFTGACSKGMGQVGGGRAVGGGSVVETRKPVGLGNQARWKTARPTSNTIR